MNIQIPIENIYFLLCYAWNKLEEKDIVNVKTSGDSNILNLFSRVLISGLTHLFKRGIDREYSEYCAESRGIKGKINFRETIQKNILLYGRVQCNFDEMDNNTLHNQILKATIKILIRLKELDEEYRDELLLLLNRLNDIEDIIITSNVFSKVKLNRNNYFYDFLLKICELIIDNIFISEEKGESKFRDFLQDEIRMRAVFEEFLRNFYKFEQSAYKVNRENIYWDFESKDDISEDLLPEMQTDISMESKNRKIIIDAKYYKEALINHFGKRILQPSNLYQLAEYLRNIENLGGLNENCEGILIYPTVDEPLDLEYRFPRKKPRHVIKIKTINLMQPWQNINNDLLAIINYPN
jgi:5-methylcytosine-specific restriction enzyme subunit McrC